MEAEQQTDQPLAVQAEDLHKSYGDNHVLKGVSFEVKPGEVFVLMGPSGSGKSVLLKQIIGLEAPDQGRVRINGLDAADQETHEKFKTALVFQAGALFNSMSVFDNLALYLREHRMYDEKTIRDKVKRVLQVLSIEQTAKQFPASLSGGMRKRVAVARAIVMEPQLILYDEPTSELDPIRAATVSELIATVRDETNVTSIVVSHDKDLAKGIADRVGLLWDGELIFNGTREEFTSSEDDRVRDFLNPTINPSNPRFRQQRNSA
ncbi:MAG: putative ABC transport system ATP-binding protein [Puniceicoccaceae bacterium 5H]|nr:MAG: putative ABC transport system ATP-binding protein [Puniceicoccaceae bacterium 5H]